MCRCLSCLMYMCACMQMWVSISVHVYVCVCIVGLILQGAEHSGKVQMSSAAIEVSGNSGCSPLAGWSFMCLRWCVTVYVGVRFVCVWGGCAYTCIHLNVCIKWVHLFECMWIECEFFYMFACIYLNLRVNFVHTSTCLFECLPVHCTPMVLFGCWSLHVKLVHDGVCICIECAVVSICRRANLFQYMHHCLQAHMFLWA